MQKGNHLLQTCYMFCAQSSAVCAFCPVCRGAFDIDCRSDQFAVSMPTSDQVCSCVHWQVCIGNGSFMSAFYKILSEGTFDDDDDTFAHLVFLAFRTSTLLICVLQAEGSSTHAPTLQAGSARAAGVLYAWHRLIVLHDPTTPGRWCALFHFPPNTFGAYTSQLEELEYCWASWFPAHLTNVQLY